MMEYIYVLDETIKPTYEELQEKLDYLKSVGRKETAEKIKVNCLRKDFFITLQILTEYLILYNPDLQ